MTAQTWTKGVIVLLLPVVAACASATPTAPATLPGQEPTAISALTSAPTNVLIPPALESLRVTLSGSPCEVTQEGTTYAILCEANPQDTIEVHARVHDDTTGIVAFLGMESAYRPSEEATLEASIPADLLSTTLPLEIRGDDGELMSYSLQLTPGTRFAPVVTVENATGLTGDVSLVVSATDLNGSNTIGGISVSQEFNLQTDNKRISEYISNQDLAPFTVEQIELAQWRVTFRSEWPGRFPLHFVVPDAEGNVTDARVPVEVYWAQQPMEIRGAMIEGWAMENPRDLGTSDFEAVLDRLVQDNFNYVSVTAIWMLDDANSYTFNRAPSRWADSNFASLTDSQISEIIQLAHERGMGVMVKPMVFVEDWTWIGSIRPADAQTWFSNYESQVLLPMARLAAENDAELLCLFNDSGNQGGYRAIWTDIIGDVREIYGGRITLGDSNYPSLYRTGLSVTFVNLLDVYGANAYIPGSGYPSYPTIAGENDPTVDEMQANIARHYDGRSGVLTSRDMRLIVTELGMMNVDGANTYPTYTGNEGTVDNQEWVEYFEASLRVLSTRQWVEGAFAWSVTPSESIKYANEAAGTTHDLRVAPIEDLLRIWFYDAGGTLE